LVLTVRAGAYEAHTADGWSASPATPTAPGGATRCSTAPARNPLADQAAGRFAGAAAEAAARWPRRSANAYPHAYEARWWQFFEAPMAPDLCVVHSAAHNYEDRGGHRGEHGSLDVVQARAPFVLAGRGVRADGMVDRSLSTGRRGPDAGPPARGCRFRPGIGLNGRPRADAYLARQDGDPLTDLLVEGDRPRHVVGFLLDGCNPNTLYRLAESGQAPNVARLMAMGTAFRHGAMAGMPTVTLANHTSLHHRRPSRPPLDPPQRLVGPGLGRGRHHQLPGHLAHGHDPAGPGIETVFEAIRSAEPAAFTAAVNEPADRGATFSTFDFFRRGDIPPFPQPEEIPT